MAVLMLLEIEPHLLVYADCLRRELSLRRAFYEALFTAALSHDAMFIAIRRLLRVDDTMMLARERDYL